MATATATERLDRTFAALADPTRRAILGRLAAGEASVTELAEPFEMSMPAVSKHLKVLERAGLIVRGRERAVRARPARGRATSGEARQLVTVGETYDFEIQPTAGQRLWLELRRGNGEWVAQTLLTAAP